MADNDRVTLILAAVAFGALVVGLLASLFLRLRAASRGRLHAGKETLSSFREGAETLDTAAIAEEALNLVDTVRAENAQLRAEITALRQQAQVPVADSPQLTAPQWLALVNERPDQAPHLAVYGPSGVGKTTLVQGIVALRGGKLCIIDPKPTPPSRRKWGGLPYLRIDRDGSYTSIAAGLRALREEFNRRLVALEDGEPLEPLTIIIDEYKLLARKLKDLAPQLYIDLSDLGRELQLRLIVLSTTRSVKGLGIEGMGDTRDNFVVIEIDRQHQATLEFGDDTFALATAPVVTLAGQPFPANRWWSPVADQQSQDQVARLLSTFLGEELAVPVHDHRAETAAHASTADRTGTGDESGTPQQDAVPAHTVGEIDVPGVPAVLSDEAIRTLYTAGWSKNKIAAMLRGSKPKRLAQIDQALDSAGELAASQAASSSSPHSL